MNKYKLTKKEKETPIIFITENMNKHNDTKPQKKNISTHVACTKSEITITTERDIHRNTFPALGTRWHSQHRGLRGTAMQSAFVHNRMNTHTFT